MATATTTPLKKEQFIYWRYCTSIKKQFNEEQNERTMWRTRRTFDITLSNVPSINNILVAQNTGRPHHIVHRAHKLRNTIWSLIFMFTGYLKLSKLSPPNHVAWDTNIEMASAWGGAARNCRLGCTTAAHRFLVGVVFPFVLIFRSDPDCRLNTHGLLLWTQWIWVHDTIKKKSFKGKKFANCGRY